MIRLRTCPAVLLAAVLTAAPAAAATPAAPHWPHTITEPDGTVTVYQPQAIAWPKHKELTARAAVAITPKGQGKPILGTIEVAMATQTDPAAGIVHLSDARLVASHFPSLDTAQASALAAKIKAALPDMQTRRVPLSAVLLSLTEKAPAKTVAVNNDPPPIFYSQSPASLVVFDGEPVLVPAGHSGLSYAVNTNWDVFTDGHRWYLLDNGLWLAAPAATGPYKPVTELPPGFASIPNDANFAEVHKHLPPRPPKAGSAVPHVFVSTRPAEIIVTAGSPRFAPVPGTSLEVVQNTASALFLDTAQGQFYYLASGRWFAASGLDGPWHYAGNDLPPDFALIPPDGPEGAVLASVPGTVQSEEAVLRAQIPQEATLKKSAATLQVAYSGAPDFAPIPGTTMRYAVNTGYEVIAVGDRYYACYQGAWFVAASPTGPWALAAAVPPVIYTIPPSNPLYNVTYVQVYSATPTTVTYGYTAGYMMGFITASALVYGTGYYYPPVVIHGPLPIYYPYPYSYAGSVWYNPATGGWARGGTIYGPYGGAASAGRYYNPSTGAWARGAAVYGPNGGAGAWSYYNPRTGTYHRGSASWGGGSGTAYGSFYNPRYGVAGSTTQNASPYARWGSSEVSGPNRTVNTASGSNARGSAGAFSSSTGAKGAGYHGAGGNRGGAVKAPGGDVYAGRDGNVYQHSSSGWSKWNNGAWTPVQPQANGGQRLQSRQPGGTLGATQGGHEAWRQDLSRDNFQQLQQDWRARSFGERGGSFGGRDFGGGRFRR